MTTGKKTAGRNPDIPENLPCWVMTDGSAGIEGQCVGLAEALGLDPQIHRLRPRWPWRKLPAGLWGPFPLPLWFGADAPRPPWPALLISSGRIAAAPAAAIRRRTGGTTRAVHIQDPRLPADRFDLIAAPMHDALDAGNVVTTLGSLSGVTPEKLESARTHFAPLFENLARPLVAVLVGGNSRHHRLPPPSAARLAQQLVSLADSSGGSLAITPSRRTPDAALETLSEIIGSDKQQHFLWDGAGENPYLGMLALADAIVVTNDSISMASEAAQTGKPLYVAELDGGGRRIDLFHNELERRGISRPLESASRLEEWHYPVPDDTKRVAGAVQKLLDRI